MDGRSCRTPMGVGMNSEGAFFQTWESNRSVRMENVGDTDVVNPWLSNGRNKFRNVAEIVQSAITPDMTDAEKAFALWFQQIQYRHHSGGDNSELGDPVKVFNIYGYNTCGNDSICLGTLFKQAGFKTAPARALGHCISQAFCDGAWHFFDGDMHCVYLLRDNETVASDLQLARDHDLVKRTHSNGILLLDTQWDGQGTSSLYFTETEISGERSGKADTTMNMVLRPGEAIVWRWGQLKPLKYHGMLQTMPTYPARDLQRPVGVSSGPEQTGVAAGSDEGREHPVGQGGTEGGRGEDRLDCVDHEKPLCVCGRADRGRRQRRPFFHLSGRKDLAEGAGEQPGQVLFGHGPGLLPVSVEVRVERGSLAEETGDRERRADGSDGTAGDGGG